MKKIISLIILCSCAEGQPIPSDTDAATSSTELPSSTSTGSFTSTVSSDIGETTVHDDTTTTDFSGSSTFITSSSTSSTSETGIFETSGTTWNEDPCIAFWQMRYQEYLNIFVEDCINLEDDFCNYRTCIANKLYGFYVIIAQSWDIYPTECIPDEYKEYFMTSWSCWYDTATCYSQMCSKPEDNDFCGWSICAEFQQGIWDWLP